MNKAILVGNLTRDPESRTANSGVTVCNFTLALNRRFANQQGVREADFVPIVTFNKTAELCARYLTKGRKCAVVGYIQTRTYDAQDGSKRYVTEVVADEVEFLGSQNGDMHSTGAVGDDGTAVPAPAKADYKENAGFTEVDDDELPF